jgi:hypothetical protein
MAQLRVATTLDASPDDVWTDLGDVASHTEWMRDAVAIRFVGDRHEGVGTCFECDTRIGPFRLTDVMEITRWDPPTAMGVRHTGIVVGEGVFTLRDDGRGGTRFEWSEVLRFPWWMGGRVGGWLAVPVLTAVWRRSLRNLAARFDR